MADSSSRVAVCVTGLQRSLLELPVVRTYNTHIVTPLTTAHHLVHTHLAIVVRPNINGSHTRLRESASVAYSPQTIELIPLVESETWSANSCGVRTNRTWANPRGDMSVLAQWYAIGQCYGTVEAAEQSGGWRYAWMLRVRTDLVYYSDVPLPSTLSPKHAYVSSSGMTNDPLYRCMNDQIMLCPRGLCRPYFKLLELWTSPHCQAGSATDSIFATTRTEPHGAQGPPEAAFTLPLPPPEARRPHMSAQWYFFARYSLRKGAPCTAKQSTERCCGLLREIAWPYSIARGRSSLECQFRLAEYPARRPSEPDAAHRPSFYSNVSVLLRRCRELQGEWRRTRHRGG